jgi:hypothetical protein
VQQVVGTIQGLPVVTDPSIPTNQGAGTNQDMVLVLKTDDVVLYESGIKTRVLQETLSGTLTVRCRSTATWPSRRVGTPPPPLASRASASSPRPSERTDQHGYRRRD